MKQRPLSGLLGIAVGAALFLCAFRLQFGRIDQYALGFAVFLVLLAAGFEYLPREALKAQAQGLDQRPTYRRHPLDVLGVVWLLAIPFAPALSWMLTNFFDVGVGNWRLLLGVRAALCVVLPVVCVLPLLRFIRRRAGPGGRERAGRARTSGRNGLAGAQRHDRVGRDAMGGESGSVVSAPGMT